MCFAVLQLIEEKAFFGLSIVVALYMRLQIDSQHGIEVFIKNIMLVHLICSRQFTVIFFFFQRKYGKRL